MMLLHQCGVCAKSHRRFKLRLELAQQSREEHRSTQDANTVARKRKRAQNVDDTGATLRHNKLESVNNKQVYTIIYVLYNTNVDSEQAERK
mmetsp:Transcript_22976/g.46020  ORF Transcript_22976/g.46020 Transcript_22976/m.46020 type:complete len:91 (-) Transcript_22976:1863-2135(-)|eukprot:scaffold5143_cov139-Skeletonema_marinoi.AAC.10